MKALVHTCYLITKTQTCLSAPLPSRWHLGPLILMPIQMHSTISRSSNQDSFANVALIIPNFVTIFIYEDILEIIPNNKSGHLGPLHPGGSDHRSGTRWSPNNSAIAITITLVRDIDRCNTDSGHGLSSIIGSPISHGKRGIFLDKEYKILTSISTWDISAVLAICLCPSLQEPANKMKKKKPTNRASTYTTIYAPRCVWAIPRTTHVAQHFWPSVSRVIPQARCGLHARHGHAVADPRSRAWGAASLSPTR